MCTIITLCVLLALSLRFTYINIICNDWNYKLELYMDYFYDKSNPKDKEADKMYKLYLTKLLNPRIYWLSFNKWTVKRIVNDSFVIEDVNNYFKRIK